MDEVVVPGVVDGRQEALEASGIAVGGGDQVCKGDWIGEI